MSQTRDTVRLVVTEDDPGTRGTTKLADRVVEKIAARAAAGVPNCAGLPRTIAGISTGRPEVSADAVIDGAIAGLSLRIGVAYPAPVTATSRAVRAAVVETVGRLCGLTVDHVDIAVASLTRPEQAQRRVR